MHKLDFSARTLQTYINENWRIVFFGGAGVSTESGIPDFRSETGLYSMQYKYPPEHILSHRFFMEHPDIFYEFYREKILCPNARPNAAHQKLAELEKAGKLTAVITQNIDGLHTLAGSKTVYELHGSMQRHSCISCGKAYSVDHILSSTGIPYCDCGGMIRPDVVLYEESLLKDCLEGAAFHIANADLLIIGGTSLAVFPAANLINGFHGTDIILINQTKTAFDSKADLLLRAPIGEVFSRIVI